MNVTIRSAYFSVEVPIANITPGQFFVLDNDSGLKLRVRPRDDFAPPPNTYPFVDMIDGKVGYADSTAKGNVVYGSIGIG